MAENNQRDLISRVLKVIADAPAKAGWATVRDIVRQKLGEQDLSQFENLTLLEIASGLTIADLIGIADSM